MLRTELQVKVKLNLNLLLKNRVEVLLYPAQELEQILKEEKESNPFIEEVYVSQRAYQIFEERKPPEARHEPSEMERFLKAVRSELEGQDLEIAMEIVSALDDKGYFRGEVGEIALRFGVTPEYVEDLREFLMTLDPVGVCARDFREFALAQIRDLYPGDRELEKDLEKALKGEKIGEESLLKLRHLRKTPLAGSENVYKVARVDAVIELDDGELVGYLYEDFIDIKPSRTYQEMMRRVKGSAREFLRDLQERYENFRKILTLRRENLRKILDEIISVQEPFLKGEGNLRSLMVKDVASRLGISESTVSRLINSKYVKTPQGTYPFRFFFVRETAGGVSQEELMRAIREIVGSEDASSPYSDDEIAMMLRSRGFKVARRTVAKYREMLGIPSSRERRVR
jgi:RNA polymerase sigma-54 factor